MLHGTPGPASFPGRSLLWTMGLKHGGMCGCTRVDVCMHICMCVPAVHAFACLCMCVHVHAEGKPLAPVMRLLHLPAAPLPAASWTWGTEGGDKEKPSDV